METAPLRVGVCMAGRRFSPMQEIFVRAAQRWRWDENVGANGCMGLEVEQHPALAIAV